MSSTTYYKGPIGHEDLETGFGTFLRRNSLGAYESKTKIKPSHIVDWFDDIRNYDDLADAVSSIGDTPTTLLIADSVVMDENVTSIPITLKMQFIEGNTITTTGYTLGFSGSPQDHIIALPGQQIFEGTGVTFDVSGIGYAQWWGLSASETSANNATYIVAASTALGVGGHLIVSGSDDISMDSVEFTIARQIISGISKAAPILEYNDNTGDFITISGGGTHLENIWIQAGTSGTGTGVVMNDSIQLLESVTVYDFDTNVRVESDTVAHSCQINNSKINNFATYGVDVESIAYFSMRGTYLKRADATQGTGMRVAARDVHIDQCVFAAMQYGIESIDAEILSIKDCHIETNSGASEWEVHMTSGAGTITLDNNRMSGKIDTSSGAAATVVRMIACDLRSSKEFSSASGTTWIFEGNQGSTAPVSSDFATGHQIFLDANDIDSDGVINNLKNTGDFEIGGDFNATHYRTMTVANNTTENFFTLDASHGVSGMVHIQAYNSTNGETSAAVYSFAAAYNKVSSDQLSVLVDDATIALSLTASGNNITFAADTTANNWANSPEVEIFVMAFGIDDGKAMIFTDL